MALTLPHDLVFTPLDVLTAEEMNNLMDDLNFISQQFPLASTNISAGAVGSAQLAANSVTPAKINYSGTFYNGELSGLDKFTAAAWSEKQINSTSISLTSGRYLFLASSAFVGAGAAGDSEFILQLTPTGGTPQRMIQYGSQGLSGQTWTTDISIPGSSVRVAAIHNGVASNSVRWDTVYFRFLRIGN